MSFGKKPGPVCLTHGSPDIDFGTLWRNLTPKPGPMCTSTQPWETTRVDERANAIKEVQRLFDSCLKPEITLTGEDFERAAKTLGVEVELVRAVAEVESPRGPFNEEGHPTILFERHYFHDLTGGKFDKTNPTVSNAVAGGYGKYSAQYVKLEEAYKLDSSAALQSASWGKFQIMGSNYKAAGFSSVEEMIASMMKSESNQLQAFVNLIKSNGKMLDALKNKAWADFAKRYNGPKYAKNAYDTKLKAAYEAEVRKRPRTVMLGKKP